jgi:hypothetical protein
MNKAAKAKGMKLVPRGARNSAIFRALLEVGGETGSE